MSCYKSRKENPQKLTQLSSRSHPRHLVGKRTVQKDITIDTTSDSQVNSNFPNRWSPASLTFNNYFYLFLYIYNVSNYKLQRATSKITKEPKQKSRKENPQKLTRLSSRSHPRHLVGKRTAQKDITIDTTSDSQVNSNFPNRWSPASLTF